MRKGGRIEKGPAGQLVASQDPAASAHGQSCTTGQATTYTYDPSDTYVTGTTLPTPSSGVALSTSATYDLQYTGLPTSTSDPNTQTTKYTSYNSMLQPLTVTHPDGGTTQYDWYSDAYSIVQTQNSSSSTNNSFLLDGYGRPSRQALSNGQTTNPWYLQDTCYNSMGQIGFKSYPYQGTAWSTPIVCTGPADT